MHVTIENFKTGWYGISIGIKEAEIDRLIDGLRGLKKNKDEHFHARSDYDGDGGVGDIEFYVELENTKDNMELAVPPLP